MITRKQWKEFCSEVNFNRIYHTAFIHDNFITDVIWPEKIIVARKVTEENGKKVVQLIKYKYKESLNNYTKLNDLYKSIKVIDTLDHMRRGINRR